jgi:hypothetical protein
MERETTWWRNLGGLLAACVLTLLVAAPMTSAAACLCIEDTVASATQALAGQTVQADHGQDSAPCKAACCLGGHCHHAGPALDAPVSAVAAPTFTGARHVIAPAHVLPSMTVSALDRPPRG